VVEWELIVDVDDLLGCFGGVFYGTVMEYQLGCELVIVEVWWLLFDMFSIGLMLL